MNVLFKWKGDVEGEVDDMEICDILFFIKDDYVLTIIWLCNIPIRSTRLIVL